MPAIRAGVSQLSLLQAPSPLGLVIAASPLSLRALASPSYAGYNIADHYILYHFAVYLLVKLRCIAGLPLRFKLRHGKFTLVKGNRSLQIEQPLITCYRSVLRVLEKAVWLRTIFA